MKKRFWAGAMALWISLTLLSPAALAAGEERESKITKSYRDVSDIIGPGLNPGDGGEDVTIPDTESFDSNEDFKPYDPGYPKKDRYGNYTLQVPELKGRLTLSAGDKNQIVGTLFAPGTSQQNGWKDATKKWGNFDSGLCFAASSSNLISWYLDQYKKLHPEDTTEYVTEVESIFDRFRRGWDTAEGGDQKEALSWYFTGGFPNGGSQPTNNSLNGQELGGYLRGKIPHNNSKNWSLVSYDWNSQEDFSVFGSFDDNHFPFIEELTGNYDYGSYQAPLSTHERFSAHILRQLHYGACTISITKENVMGPSGHAVTLWGADYDVKTGLVTAIYLTDSDDGGGRLFKVGIKKGPGEENGKNDGIRMVGYPNHGYGDGRPFTKIKDSIVVYAPQVLEQIQSYEGPDAVIRALIPDSDGKGVEVQVSNITDKTLEYGYSYDQNAGNVTHWQTDSHFSQLEPDQYFFFARVKKGNGYEAGGVSEPAPYRVKAPSPIAEEKVPALSMGTTVFHPYNGANQYIWYGTEKGSDDSGSEAPILWRVLDSQTNLQEKGLFLMSDKLFGSGKNGDLSFSQESEHNDYQSSNARNWCQNFETSRFTAQELESILSISKTDGQYFSPANAMAPEGTMFGAQSNILSSDKVFLPSAEEILNPSYGFGTDSNRLGRYHGDYCSYWLRSPVEQKKGSAGHVDSNGYVFDSNTLDKYAARPAFNLDSNQVLYAAAVGNGQFTHGTGLEEIQTVLSCDFRLVLKDKERAFRVITSELTAQPGESVSLSYEGAVTSEDGKEYISVILMDADGIPAYYGKIAPAKAVNGTVSFDLPADLNHGTYVLKVFNEQYSGEMESGTASEFCDVQLTVRTQPVLKPIEQVTLTVPAPTTGQVPEKAAATGSGYTVVNTQWLPNDGAFQADTHYDVTITVKPESGYEFTSSSVFTLNGQVILPAVNEGNWVVTYKDFPKTKADTDPKTEITYGPDGSKIETVTYPEGKKVKTITWPNGDKAVTVSLPDGSFTTDITKADGTTAKITGYKNGHITVEVMISAVAEQEAKKSGKPFVLPIPPLKSDTQNAPVIQVKTESGKELKVTIPVSSLTVNTVAVMAHEDGTEQIIRKSSNVKPGVTLTIKSGCVMKIMDNPKVFTDTTGHWAKDSIDFVTSHQLYNGTSKTTFRPDTDMTRGMLAVVLHNLEGNPNSTVNASFKDVADGKWYTKAIYWAAEKHIVNGYGNGKFGPENLIKREQLAVMLYRYAGSPGHSGSALTFRDAKEVSTYARDAMQWAVENNIIGGVGNNTLKPQGIATRAQVAAMLKRFMENVG